MRSLLAYSGIFAASLVSLGFAALSMTRVTRESFRIARACFIAAGVVPAITVLYAASQFQVYWMPACVVFLGGVTIALPIWYFLGLVNENEKAHKEAEIYNQTPAQAHGFASEPNWGDPAYDHFFQPPEEEPRIRVSCGKSVDKSIVTANGFTYFRGRLDLVGTEPLYDLTACVNAIRKDGEKLQLNEEARLTLHPGYPILDVLNEGVAGFVDVIVVEPDERPRLVLAYNYGSVDPFSFFLSGHVFQIDVSITAKKTRTQKRTFVFGWTGDRKTAEFRMLNGLAQPSLTHDKGRRQRSPEVAAVIKDAVQLLRNNPGMLNFPLRGLQLAGVGNLQTEDDFAEVRDSVIQYGFIDPLVGLASAYPEGTEWLAAIKWANRNNVNLESWSALIDCLRYSKQETV